MTDDSPNHLSRCYLLFSNLPYVGFLPHPKNTGHCSVPDHYSYAINRLQMNEDIKCKECINNKCCHKLQFPLKIFKIFQEHSMERSRGIYFYFFFLQVEYKLKRTEMSSAIWKGGLGYRQDICSADWTVCWWLLGICWRERSWNKSIHWSPSTVKGCTRCSQVLLPLCLQYLKPLLWKFCLFFFFKMYSFTFKCHELK